MKVFRKTHFWKDNRTFIEVDAKEPHKDKGFAKEGHLLLKIGEQSNVKSAFKLTPDEARSLRDSIDMFLRFHDMKLSEFMTDQQEQYEKVPDYFQRSSSYESEEKSRYDNYNSSRQSNPTPNFNTPEPEKQEEINPFFMFGSAETKKELKEEKKEEDKKKSEFYF